MDGQKREVFKRSAKMTRTPPQANTTNNIRCGVCKKGPKHDNIVQCDGCDIWYHYKCVGVDSSVMERDWYCPKCQNVEPQSKEENLRDNTDKPLQENQFTNPLQTDQENQFTNPLKPHQEPMLEVASNVVNPGTNEFVDSQRMFFPEMFTTTPPISISGEDYLASVTKSKSNVNDQTDMTSISQDAQQNSSTSSQVTIRSSQKVLHGKSSSKSRSVSSKASSVIDLTLQRFEEERQLREKRDKEYLDKKYAFLQTELGESDDENIYRADLVNDWVLDQYNQAPVWNQEFEMKKRQNQLSSTTNPVTSDQHSGVKKKIYPIASNFQSTVPENTVPILISGGYGSASNDPGISTIISVQDNTDLANYQQASGISNYSMSRSQNHVVSSNQVSNTTSSSSNMQVLNSETNILLGNTNPIMSSYASGTNWSSQASFNPTAMPYTSARPINNFQPQINNISSNGIINPTYQSNGVISSSGFAVPVVQSRIYNATVSGGYSATSRSQVNTINSSGGFNTRAQSRMNTTSFGGIFNPASQINASSMPNYGGNQYSSVPIINASVQSANSSGLNPNRNVPIISSSGLQFNANVPITNANNSGIFNTFQPQMSFVQPTYMANSGSNQMVPVVPLGQNFGTPGGFGYHNIATRLSFRDKDLKFTGKPEDWPLFESEFLEQSTLCGYSDRENLSRLRKMLDGDALTSVKSMLQGSMNLPIVLSTLRMLYGKPEAVINALYQKALETEPIRPGKLSSLIKFALVVLNLCGTMVSNELTHHLNNPTLLAQLVSKLPDNLKLEWGSIKRYNPNVNLSDLGNWLYDKAQDASEVTIIEQKSKAGSDKRGESKPKSKSENETSFLNSHVTADSTSNGKKIQKSDRKSAPTSGSCSICQQTQCKVVENCAKFKSLSQNERWEKVVANKLCRRCFGQHHHFRCKIQKKCGINNCERLHHNLLHKDSVEEKPETKGENKSAIVQQSRLNTHQIYGENTLLPIIPVILSHNGRNVKTFAFFDEGSTITLVETRYSLQLGLSGSRRNLCLRWTNGIVHSEKGSMMVSLNVSGIRREHSSYQLPVVRTVENLGLPEQSIDLEKLTKRYPYLNDIPVDGFNRVKIGILIGGNYAKLALPSDVREGDWGEPVARKTRLGWVISGPHDGESGHGNFVQYHVHECPCQGEYDRELEKLVTDFFSLENFGVQMSSRCIESKEDQRAKYILESTTKFLGDRYETGLIWKYDEINLPNNFDMALKRLECVERKMASDPKLLENFNKQIQEFLVKGYARKLKRTDFPLPKGRTWYLPLFPHIHPKKPEKV